MCSSMHWKSSMRTVVRIARTTLKILNHTLMIDNSWFAFINPDSDLCQGYFIVPIVGFSQHGQMTYCLLYPEKLIANQELNFIA